MKTFIIIKTILLILLLQACGGSSNDDTFISSWSVATSEIYISALVTVNNNESISADIQLTENAPAASNTADTFIKLFNNDELWLSTNTTPFEVNNSDNIFDSLNELTQTQFKFELEEIVTQCFYFCYGYYQRPGEYYRIRTGPDFTNELSIFLLRDNARDAIETFVRLPNDFQITSPSQIATFNPATDDIEITWSSIQADTLVDIDIRSICGNSLVDQTIINQSTDNGTYIVTAGTIDLGTASSNQSSTCGTTIYVRKTIIGIVDPNYLSGQVFGQRIKAVTFITNR